MTDMDNEESVPAEQEEALAPVASTENVLTPEPDILPEINSSVMVSEPVNPLRAVNPKEFIDWALDITLPFLFLADLERVATATMLRGTKEDEIRNKIQMANSVLVLFANYGSEKDDEELVKVCELYAEKMKTIIKRLCL